MAEPFGTKGLARQHPNTTPKAPPALFAPASFTTSLGPFWICEVSSQRDWDGLGLSLPRAPRALLRLICKDWVEPPSRDTGGANGRGTPKPARPLCLASPRGSHSPWRQPCSASTGPGWEGEHSEPHTPRHRCFSTCARCSQVLQDRAGAQLHREGRCLHPRARSGAGPWRPGICAEGGVSDSVQARVVRTSNTVRAGPVGVHLHAYVQARLTHLWVCAVMTLMCARPPSPEHIPGCRPRVTLVYINETSSQQRSRGA